MPIDPNIPLQAGNVGQGGFPGFDFGTNLQNAQQLLQFRDAQQQFRNQNALKGILSQPGAIGPDGNPTEAAMQQVMGVDPNYGMKLRQNALVQQEHQLKMSAMKTDVWQQKLGIMNDKYGEVDKAYKDAIAAGKTPEIAQQLAQDELDRTNQELSQGGSLSETEQRNLPTRFDPIAFQRFFDGSKNIQTMLKTQYQQARDRYDRPQEMQWTDDKGAVHRQMVMQDNTTGAWVTADDKHTKIDYPVAPYKTPTPGSPSAQREKIAEDVSNDPKWKDRGPGEQAQEVERRFKSAQNGQLLENETPEERASYAGQVASGMPTIQAIPGYGRDVRPLREQAHADAIKLIMRDHPEMDAEQAGLELARRSIDFAAGKKSVAQLETGLGATRQALGQLDYNVDQVSNDLKLLGSTDISPVVNAIVRGVEKWDGNPAYSQLFFHMQAAATESARILSGGVASIAQLHEGARKEAEKWANINMTPAMWNGDGKDVKGVAQSMKDEGLERLKTFESAIRQQRLTGQGSGQEDKKDGGDKKTEDNKGGSKASTIKPGEQPRELTKEEYEAAPVGTRYLKDGKLFEKKAASGSSQPAAAPAQPASAGQEGATAINRKTGQRLIFKGGQWVPLAAAPSAPTN